MSNRQRPKITLDSIPVLVATGGRKKPKKNPDRPLPGVCDLASLDRVIQHLTMLKQTLTTEVRNHALDIFLREGAARGERPLNFYGTEAEIVEGAAKRRAASVELRKHTYPLSAEAVANAQALGLPIVERVESHATYVINPKYATDRALMERMVANLNKIRNLPPDILQRQEGSSRWYCTDLTIPTIFKKSPAQAETLLKTYAIFAMGKYEYESTPGEEHDIAGAWERVQRLVE